MATSQGSQKEAVENSSCITQTQVVPGFKLRIAMYMSEEIIGEAVPLTDYVLPFFTYYHLKGV